MHSAAAGFVLACILTALVTPLVRRLAVRAGVVDLPGGRRVHAAVTPRLGGVAVMFGFFVTLAVFAVVKTAVMQTVLERTDLLIGLVLGAMLVGVMGAIDDVRSLGPSYKLGAQAVAAVIAYAYGYRIDVIDLPLVGALDMGHLALPVTVIWFLAITNAVNLIDGLDGLAAGISLFAAVANLAISYVRGSDMALLLSSALGGSLLGFLRYNFNPATIFLGDSGSMFLGFALAATAIGGQLTKSSTAIALLAPVLALGVPILDTLLAMVRRTLARQSIFAADRAHIHHRMLDLGLTQRRVVLALYGTSLLLAVTAVVVAIGHSDEIGIALAVVGMALFYGVRALRVRASALQERKSARERALLGLRETTQRILDGLATCQDEHGMRQSLAHWPSSEVGATLEFLAGEVDPAEPPSHAFHIDVSAAGRRRYLRLAAESRGLDAVEPSLLVHAQTIAAACREALARSAQQAGLGSTRLRAAHAHAGTRDE